MAYENLSKDTLERLYYLGLLERSDGSIVTYAGTVGSAGESFVISPAAGKRVEILWVYALTDPDSATSPLITIKLGGTAIYSVYAIAHTQVFRGPVNGSVSVTLSEAATVAVTIHYKETV